MQTFHPRQPSIGRAPHHDDFGDRVHHLMDNVSESFHSISDQLPHLFGGFEPHIDICDSGDALVFLVELPGMSADEVDISASDRTLTIRGEKTDDRTDRYEHCQFAERRFGKFHRSFGLPDSADLANADAEMVNGLLAIRIPRSPEASKKHRIAVK